MFNFNDDEKKLLTDAYQNLCLLYMHLLSNERYDRRIFSRVDTILHKVEYLLTFI